MMKNRRVDIMMGKLTKWELEMAELRSIALESGLTEDLKWGQPCYTLDGANVFLIHAFKEYCAILFMKGVLMKDPKGILIQQTANVQSGRHIRFTHLSEIVKLRKTLKVYISDAMTIEKAGLKVPVKKASEFEVPADIQAKIKKVPGLAVAFKKLTPGRQRVYVLHFEGAKQEKTQVSRIEKAAPKIFEGKGLND